MEDETGIYRAEVLTMMGVLADIHVNVENILALLQEEDDDGQEEEEDPDT